MPTIYFFRSLNTSGGDLIQIGPLKLGTFWSKLQAEFDSEGLDFRPVPDMGGGPLEEQAELALAFIKRNQLENPTHEFHFFGHSAGGLVMKLVAMDPHIQKNLRSMISMGTPHKGTKAAVWAAKMRSTHPKIVRLLHWAHYNVDERVPTFESFDRVAQTEFHFPQWVFTGSIVCAPSKKTWSSTYKWIHRLLPKNAIPEPCDGLIEKESQIFGRHQWEFNLDHIQQVGFGGQRQEFKSLCHFLSNLWKDLSKGLPTELSTTAAPSVGRTIPDSNMHASGSIIS